MDTKLILALIPLALINLGLIIWCLVDWLKREHFRLLNKWIWLLIFLFIQYLGPVLYLILGRDHEND
jgi:Phospholipase_D-nuclease N-terminal